MGNGNIKKSNLKKSELLDFHNMTLLNENIIITIHNYFEYHSSKINDDGILDYDEFCIMLNRKDNLLNKKIFSVIDLNKDNFINFREFLKFISIFNTGTREEQLELTYQIYSDENSNMIEKEYIKKILKEGILEDYIISEYIDSKCIDEIVNATFGEASIIDKCYFDSIIKFIPSIIDWIRYDVNKIPKFIIKTKRKASCLSIYK